MRAFVLGLVATLVTLGVAQSNSGKYTAPGKPAQSWQINGNHCLLWDGVPYLPVGVRIDGTPEQIAAAKAAGFTDVIVELPAGGTGWDQAIKALEAANMRYLIAISSLAPMAEGVAIEPAGYRVTGITKAQRLQVKIPGASSALAVVVNRRDSSVVKSERQPVLDGTLALDVRPLSALEQVLLIYPRMRSLEQPDLWEALDEHRDRLLTTFRIHPPGPGFRGILNPFGRMAAWAKADPHFVPTTAYFREEFSAFLREKYRSLETAMKAWSMPASDIDSFERLARLAPLWSGGTRGVPQLWDVDTDKLYNCNPSRCQAWGDIREAIAATSARRYTRFAAALRSIVDVPVLQEWNGWSPLYEIPNPAVDGLGMHASGTSPSELMESASRATSSILRWQKPGWLLACDVEPGTTEEAANQLANVLEDLSSMGARGWFLRSDSPVVAKAMAAQVSRANDGSVAQYSPSALFYPENAFNPATPQRLPGNRWWLPAPANGNRVDLGSHYFAYRYQDGIQDFTAIWSDQPVARVKLRMQNPKLATFTGIDTLPIEPKLQRDGVQITLGPIPVIVSGTAEIPIPEPAYAELLSRMEQLFAIADSTLMDLTESRFLFKDALAGFDRNPGGSYAAMRQQYDRISLRMGRYNWIEAESSRSNNFSQVLASPGCSNGNMLSLKTQIASPGEGYFADYTVPVRSQDEIEIWLAARIPKDQRENVELTLAGDKYAIKSEPVSPYGQGFAWYRLGTTKLGGNTTNMHIEVKSQTADLALDTIALIPGQFQPRGVAAPDPIVFTVGKIKKG